jgi:hypothetical protein
MSCAVLHAQVSCIMSRTGCSVITRSVVGASGLVGCWFWTVAVVASQVASGAVDSLEENQEKRPLANMLIFIGVGVGGMSSE